MDKFSDVLGRFTRRELTGAEAGVLLGMSERSFRRYRQRVDEEGALGLVDKRLGRRSDKAVPVDELDWLLDQCREHHLGWNVKHFHEHIQKHHGFEWSYTLVKNRLQRAGLVQKAKMRGAHRRKRQRKPCIGMMLHQDGSRHEWLEGQPMLDLIVTLDDASSEVCSAFLTEEEGTMSTFEALLEVFSNIGKRPGGFCSAGDSQPASFVILSVHGRTTSRYRRAGAFRAEDVAGAGSGGECPAQTGNAAAAR